MSGFNKSPSAVQIWLAQMIVLLFFSDPVIRLISVPFRNTHDNKGFAY